jgi:PAS domain S-box-containing protein
MEAKPRHVGLASGRHSHGLESQPAAFLADGRIASQISAQDWSSSPLGPIDRWPSSLKIALALLLRSPLPMLLMWGKDGIFLCNDAYASSVGDVPHLGRAVRDCSDALCRFHISGLQAGFAGETRSYRHEEVTLRGQERVFLHLDYWPVADDAGRPVGVFGNVHNTTERVLAERNLRKTAERFHAFLVASTTSMYRMSADWKEMQQLDGQGFLSDTAEPSADWLQSYIPAIEQPLVLAKIDEAIRGKIPFDLEHRVHLADGSFGWVHSKAVPLFNGRGDILEWFGAASDITERKRMEDALRANEERFRTMADALPQLAWMADSRGWIYWYNRRWYEYTGTTPEAAAGWGWRTVHHPDHVERVVKSIQHSWDTGEPWEDTFPLRGANGQYRWFLSRAVPLKDSEGRVMCWFGTNTDITEQRKREDFQKLLLHEISHRVKNSLAMVSGLLELQAKGVKGPLRHTLEDASVRVRTVATVHDQLWRQADAREIELAPFLSNLAAAVATAAPRHATVVDVEPAVVSADAAVPIGLLVNELVINAYKHAYAAGNEGEVRIAGRRVKEQWYELAVSDAGRGLPSDFNLRGARSSLGMRVVTNLATQLSGTLQVSAAHPGTRFTVEFPIKQPAARP